MIYRFLVTETRLVDVAYSVEADSLNEAKEFAEQGETTYENDWNTREVLNRVVIREI